MNLLHFDFSNLRQVLLQAIVIVCFGTVTGLMFNFPLLWQMAQGEDPLAALLVSDSASLQDPRTVLLEDVVQQLENVTLVDARIPELYRQGHIPGAVLLPFSEQEGYLDPFLQRVDRAQPLIIYCSGYGCPDSYDLAILLMDKGYLDVSVFEGGFPQWQDAGKPVEMEAP